MKFPNLLEFFFRERFDHQLALSLMLARPDQQALPPSPPLCEAELFDAEWSPSIIHKLEGYLGEREE